MDIHWNTLSIFLRVFYVFFVAPVPWLNWYANAHAHTQLEQTRRKLKKKEVNNAIVEIVGGVFPFCSGEKHGKQYTKRNDKSHNKMDYWPQKEKKKGIHRPIVRDGVFAIDGFMMPMAQMRRYYKKFPEFLALVMPYKYFHSHIQ